MSAKAISDVSTAARGPARSPESASRVVPALTILSHPMAHRVGERCLLDALSAGREVGLSRNAPELVRPGSALGSPLVDPYVSRRPIRFVPGPRGSLRVVKDDGSALVVNGAEVRDEIEIPPEQLAAGVPLELAGRVVLCLHAVVLGDVARSSHGMVGESSGIAQVRLAIEQIVDLELPVLVRGETGTGKELIARAIHDSGPRRAGPFVAVNLGAIPGDLAAAELFGASRGSYTGAIRDREGLFRAADGGTLFLDEVGEASAEVQVLLLRVLETGMLYPVGSSTPVAVDVRLIAATDADLEERIRQGAFKAPLLHRLAGYEIRSPPLRERREDIGLLFHHFARQELESLGEAHRLSPGDPYCEPWLPAALATRLVRHAWPGNVRQLRNVTRQLVIGSRGKATLQMDLPTARSLDTGEPPISAARPPDPRHAALRPATASRSAPEPPAAGPRRRRSTEVSEAELLAALRESGWDVKAAAALLGVARSSVYDLIDRCPGLRTAGDLSPEEIRRSFHECRGDLDEMVRRLEVSKSALNRRVKELGLL